MALAGMVVTLMLSAFTGTMQLFYENETAGLFLWGQDRLYKITGMVFNLRCHLLFVPFWLYCLCHVN